MKLYFFKLCFSTIRTSISSGLHWRILDILFDANFSPIDYTAFYTNGFLG